MPDKRLPILYGTVDSEYLNWNIEGLLDNIESRIYYDDDPARSWMICEYEHDKPRFLERFRKFKLKRVATYFAHISDDGEWTIDGTPIIGSPKVRSRNENQKS